MIPTPSPRKLQAARARGYTLIEMVVTISILGVLAAIAFQRGAGVVQRANQVSYSSRAYSLIADARNLALNRNAQVVVIVDTSTANSGSGGVYEILDPTRAFTPALTSSWSRSYTAIGSTPVSANTTIFGATPVASLFNSFRFGQGDAAGKMSLATAAQVTSYLSQVPVNAALSGTPWAVPSGSQSNSFSGTGCSFCNGSAGFGYILVSPSGVVRLSNPDDLTQLQPVGAKGYLFFVNTDRNAVDRGIFVSSPTGLTHLEIAG